MTKYKCSVCGLESSWSTINNHIDIKKNGKDYMGSSRDISPDPKHANAYMISLAPNTGPNSGGTQYSTAVQGGPNSGGGQLDQPSTSTSTSTSSSNGGYGDTDGDGTPDMYDKYPGLNDAAVIAAQTDTNTPLPSNGPSGTQTSKCSYCGRIVPSAELTEHIAFNHRSSGGDGGGSTTTTTKSTLVAPAGWNEKAYLEANPDVAKAIANGTMPSALHHWHHHGKYEGRPLAPVASSTPPTPKFTLVRGDGPTGPDDGGANKGNGAAVYALNERGERFHITADAAKQMRANGTWTDPKVVSQKDLDAKALRYDINAASDINSINKDQISGGFMLVRGSGPTTEASYTDKNGFVGSGAPVYAVSKSGEYMHVTREYADELIKDGKWVAPSVVSQSMIDTELKRMGGEPDNKLVAGGKVVEFNYQAPEPKLAPAPVATVSTTATRGDATTEPTNETNETERRTGTKAPDLDKYGELREPSVQFAPSSVITEAEKRELKDFHEEMGRLGLGFNPDGSVDFTHAKGQDPDEVAALHAEYDKLSDTEKQILAATWEPGFDSSSVSEEVRSAAESLVDAEEGSSDSGVEESSVQSSEDNEGDVASAAVGAENSADRELFVGNETAQNARSESNRHYKTVRTTAGTDKEDSGVSSSGSFSESLAASSRGETLASQTSGSGSEKVYVAKGGSVTKMIQDIAAENGQQLSGQEAWKIYENMKEELSQMDNTYKMQNGHVGLSKPGEMKISSGIVSKIRDLSNGEGALSAARIDGVNNNPSSLGQESSSIGLAGSHVRNNTSGSAGLPSLP